jgi:hypothetical protein
VTRTSRRQPLAARRCTWRPDALLPLAAPQITAHSELQSSADPGQMDRLRLRFLIFLP